MSLLDLLRRNYERLDRGKLWNLTVQQNDVWDAMN